MQNRSLITTYAKPVPLNTHRLYTDFQSTTLKKICFHILNGPPRASTSLNILKDMQNRSLFTTYAKPVPLNTHRLYTDFQSTTLKKICFHILNGPTKASASLNILKDMQNRSLFTTYAKPVPPNTHRLYTDFQSTTHVFFLKKNMLPHSQ
jgi:hypothetical protein